MEAILKRGGIKYPAFFINGVRQAMTPT